MTSEATHAEIIHFWTGTTEPSPCGLDIVSIPYTYGSPEWHEVSCSDCLTHKPDPKRYRYMVKYIIVDPFGELVWKGTCDISQDVPRPSDEGDIAKLDALVTSRTIRNACDQTPGCPPGRVIITAVSPL